MTTDHSSGYRQLDHTADVALELWASDEHHLLVTGARAIVDILTDGAHIEQTASRRISLDAVDAEDRLVQWLNEVLVAAMVDGFLVADARVRLDGTVLEAELLGENGGRDRLVTELKSVTYHDLYLDLSHHGARARVVIDV